MKRFAIIGVGGYVAPRHLKAIAENNHELIASLDPSDSVGIMDSYFPQASFFTEFERFDRFLNKMAEQGKGIDYLTVCSPNYLHDAHIRYGLRMGADVICEKPLVLNPWNLDALVRIEENSKQRIFNILQLRLHPDLIELKKSITQGVQSEAHDVILTYIAPRGLWYHASWKGSLNKSGGVITNIGIHFFDLLIWLFGPVKRHTLHQRSHDRGAGYLELENAKVKWFLSINEDHLPPSLSERRTYRSITIDGEEVEFSEGFEDLHTLSYNEILQGNGFGAEDVRPSLELTYRLRHQDLMPDKGQKHEFCKHPLNAHPFDHNQNADQE